MKPLSELTSQAPILDFEGWFIIRPFDGWDVWMENSSGEGCTVSKAEFLSTLAKLFERNFN